ncbi:MAG TPA: type II secretion system F family protein [Burkholderiales bacterium]|nr:type II secretion system F family protein [Burkholderiales bacterium]
MPSFEYKAVDKTGKTVRGGLEAVNEADLELRLRRMSLDLITCKSVDRKLSRFSGGGRITRQDLINFCFDIEQMSRSGIPMLDGLRDLRNSIESPRFREVLTVMIEDMEGGKLLSQCMAGHPETFDKVFVSLVAAGEATGRLPEVFQNLAESLKWQDELASQTRRLLIYPSMVLLVVTGVVLFLLIYLVPQVTQLLKTMGIELPFQTRILIGASNLVLEWWPVLFGVPLILGIVAMIAGAQSPRLQYLWDRLKLRLPIVGSILQKIILARFATFFALMYESGITVLEAMRTSEDIVGNRVIADGLQRVGQQVSAGASLTECFHNLGIFPPLVIRMLRVGENTGALDVALRNVNYFYTRDVRESVDKALKLLEPTITLGLGVVLALIMWSVLSPVYDVLSKLKF